MLSLKRASSGVLTGKSVSRQGSRENGRRVQLRKEDRLETGERSVRRNSLK
jgi:hypothetical protein